MSSMSSMYSMSSMSSMSYSRQIAQEVVDFIREEIIEMLNDIPDGDPWDEEDGGAGWLENEVGMATEFLEKIKPSVVYPRWNTCETVQIFQDKMATLISDSDLEFIRFFVVQMGGTGEREFFELRNKSQTYIVNWFKEKGYQF